MVLEADEEGIRRKEKDKGRKQVIFFKGEGRKILLVHIYLNVFIIHFNFIITLKVENLNYFYSD